MKPKTDLAIRVMRRALKEYGFSPTELFDATFHLTDWLGDLEVFVDFLERPEKYTRHEVQKLLIAFLIHAPWHITQAANIVLEPPAKTKRKKPASKPKRPRK